MRYLPHLTRLNGHQVAVPFIFCDETHADEQTHLCRLTRIRPDLRDDKIPGYRRVTRDFLWSVRESNS